MKNKIQTSTLALQFGARGRDGKIKYSNKVIAVRDIEEAADKWEKIRDKVRGESGRGASESPLVFVVDTATGERVARISYNGRAWATDGTEIPLKGYKTAAEHEAEGWKDYLVK